MEKLKSYYDFAENDYQFLKSACEHGIIANSMGAMAQNICERYLKHLINSYISVEKCGLEDTTAILSTHNLNKLINFWNSNSEYPIGEDAIREMQEINGYYFSTKYPGDDSETLTEGDIKDCLEAVDACKKDVDDIISKIEKTTAQK